MFLNSDSRFWFPSQFYSKLQVQTPNSEVQVNVSGLVRHEMFSVCLVVCRLAGSTGLRIEQLQTSIIILGNIISLTTHAAASSNTVNKLATNRLGFASFRNQLPCQTLIASSLLRSKVFLLRSCICHSIANSSRSAQQMQHTVHEPRDVVT